MLRILIGVIIGSVLAIVMPDMNAVSILSDLFVGALKAMAPVLVAVLVTASIAASGKGLGVRL